MLSGLESVRDLTVVGRGGFGVVYRGWQDAFERSVAVKVLNALGEEDKAARRFEHEIRAMGGAAGHPHIPQIHSAGMTEEGKPYLVMPWAEGGSLGDRLDGGPLDWQEGVDVGVKMADALQHAHERGLLHRDVKPDNILFSGAGVPLLADFGIAKVTGATATASGAVTATVLYSAPEVLGGGEATPASDVYSLAATLYTALAGRPAFGSDVPGLPALLARIAQNPPDLNPLARNGVPQPVVYAIAHGMAKDADQRPPTAAAFRDLLAAAGDGGSVPPPPWISGVAGSVGAAGVAAAANPVAAGSPPANQSEPPPGIQGSEPPPAQPWGPQPDGGGVPPTSGQPVGGTPSNRSPTALIMVGGLVGLVAIGAAVWFFLLRDNGVELVDEDRTESAAATPAQSPTLEQSSAPAVTAGPSPTGAATTEPAVTEPPTSEPATAEPTSTAPSGPVIRSVGPAGLPLYRVTGVAATDTLNVRSGPGPDNPVVFELPPDEAGIVRTGRFADVSGREWWEINLPEGGVGWASSCFLEPDTGSGSSATTYRVTGVADDDTLNVRTGPGTSNPIITELFPDARGIRRTGAEQAVGSSIWWEILLGDGMTGGVNSSFLTPE